MYLAPSSGACQYMIEIAGVKVQFTGDFSREEDRHLMAAEIPPMKPDILIMESTYGTHLHEKREEREARFTGTIHDIINRGGRCLIPVFALGRAQARDRLFFLILLKLLISKIIFKTKKVEIFESEKLCRSFH